MPKPETKKYQIVEADGSWRIISPKGAMWSQKFTTHEKAWNALRNSMGCASFTKVPKEQRDELREKLLEAKRRDWE